MSLRRCTASANVSHSTLSGRVAAMLAGTSAAHACSTRFADHGAPPTLRRISMYSIGLATRPWLMLPSSHSDSLSRLAVVVANLARQAGDIAGTVRGHRSASPRSTGLAGSGRPAPPVGMNARRRSRYALAAVVFL